MISVICQGCYFVLIARLLGNAGYGVYVGAIAVVSILSQYSALGSHSVFLRYVSAQPELFLDIGAMFCSQPDASGWSSRAR